MKRYAAKSLRSLGKDAGLVSLFAALVLVSGCSVWNPWGYSEEWPLWKKTAFFAGPGHCPVCYCVGGGAIEFGKMVSGSKADDAATSGTIHEGPNGNSRAKEEVVSDLSGS